MFGRVNYVAFKTERLADVRRMWPLSVATYRGKGFEAGFLLLDPATGESVSVVVFADEASCRANEQGGHFTAAETPFRELRKTEPDKHYFDVAAAVTSSRPDPVAWARLAKPWFKIDRFAEVLAGLPERVAAYKAEPGFRGAYLFADRKTGELVSLTLWGSKADSDANENSGAFQATATPYAAMLAKEPVRTYHEVAAVVRA